MLLAHLEGPGPQDALDYCLVDCLGLEQLLGECLDQLLFLGDDGPGPEGAGPHYLENLSVDCVLGRLAIVLGVLGLVVVEPAEGLAEAVLREEGLGHLVGLVEVVAGPGRDLPEEGFLGDPAPQDDADLIEQLGPGEHLVLVGEVLCEPEGAFGAGDDGELEEGVGVLEEPGDHPVAALVVGDRPPGLLGYELGLPLDSPDYPLGRRLKVDY